MKGISQHIPKRSCVACRQVRPKRELIRLVHTADRWVEIDYSGKKDGRGAYLCQKEECWEVGLKGNRLEYTLRTTLSLENREQLMKNGKDLLGESNGGNDK